MSPHLGTRVSLLLDGRLPPAEVERAWEHVHACYACRDLVEREGWVKTRLAGLQQDPGPAPAHLKGWLCSPGASSSYPALAPLAATTPARAHASRSRRAVGVLALSGGAAGAAVVGVLALGAAPAEAPVPDRQARLVPVVAPSATPARVPSRQRP